MQVKGAHLLYKVTLGSSNNPKKLYYLLGEKHTIRNRDTNMKSIRKFLRCLGSTYDGILDIDVFLETGHIFTNEPSEESNFAKIAQLFTSPYTPYKSKMLKILLQTSQSQGLSYLMEMRYDGIDDESTGVVSSVRYHDFDIRASGILGSDDVMNLCINPVPKTLKKKTFSEKGLVERVILFRELIETRLKVYEKNVWKRVEKQILNIEDESIQEYIYNFYETQKSELLSELHESSSRILVFIHSNKKRLSQSELFAEYTSLAESYVDICYSTTSLLTDIYCLARTLRSFSNSDDSDDVSTDLSNIIIHSGAKHTLRYIAFFENFPNAKIELLSKGKADFCIINIPKSDLPFFIERFD